MNLAERSYMSKELIKGKGQMIKEVLLKGPVSSQLDYHALGLDTFLDLIDCTRSYKDLFEESLSDNLIDELNDLLLELEYNPRNDQLGLQEIYWQKIVERIENDPKEGPSFIYRLKLWNTIVRIA